MAIAKCKQNWGDIHRTAPCSSNRVPKPDKEGTGIGLFLSWGRWDLGDWDRGLITENGGEMSKMGMGVSFPSLETPATHGNVF